MPSFNIDCFRTESTPSIAIRGAKGDTHSSVKWRVSFLRLAASAVFSNCSGSGSVGAAASFWLVCPGCVARALASDLFRGFAVLVLLLAEPKTPDGLKAASASLACFLVQFPTCSARTSLIFSHALRIDSLFPHAKPFRICFRPRYQNGARIGRSDDRRHTPRDLNRDIELGRARLRPSRHWHSARTDARPEVSQRSPRCRVAANLGSFASHFRESHGGFVRRDFPGRGGFVRHDFTSRGGFVRGVLPNRGGFVRQDFHGVGGFVSAYSLTCRPPRCNWQLATDNWPLTTNHRWVRS